MAKTPSAAFSVRYAGRVSTLTVDVGISEHRGEPPVGFGPRDQHQVKAIVDTGATGCSITEKLAQDLDLTQTGFGLLSGIGMEDQRCRTFTIDVGMPNGVRLPFLDHYVGDPGGVRVVQVVVLDEQGVASLEQGHRNAGRLKAVLVAQRCDTRSVQPGDEPVVTGDS